MDSKNLYEELNYVNHSRENRIRYANLLLKNPELVLPALNILFMVDDSVSCRAGWILEFMSTENIEAILPHLDFFTENMHKVHLDSAVRPIAKICEHLTIAYYGKKSSQVKNFLTKIHRERITEVCFDYMINDNKTAPKAYSMNSLYLLGFEFDWIHKELANILERDFNMQSSGFKARAKHILKRIKAS